MAPRRKRLALQLDDDEPVATGQVLNVRDDGQYVTSDGRVVDLSQANAEAQSVEPSSLAAAEFLDKELTARPKKARILLQEDDKEVYKPVQPSATAASVLESAVLGARQAAVSAPSQRNIDAETAILPLKQDDSQILSIIPLQHKAQTSIETHSSMRIPITTEVSDAAACSDEPLVRGSIVATISALRMRGAKLRLLKPGESLAALRPRAAIEHRDETGRVLGPREAYKQLSRKFHGTAPRKPRKDKLAPPIAWPKVAVPPPAPTAPSTNTTEQQPAKIRSKIFGMI